MGILKNWKIYIYLIVTYIAMQIGSIFLSEALFLYFGKDIPLAIKEIPFKELVHEEDISMIREAKYHSAAWSLFLSNLLAAIVFYLLVFRKKNFFQVFKGKRSSLGVTALWGVAGFFLALFGQMLAGVIEMAIGIEPGSENTAMLSDIAKLSPIIIISIVLFAPLLEEMIFRRVLFGGLYQKTNFIIATLVSAIVFAAVHGELQHTLIYMAPAVVFSFIYYKTKRLLAPIIAHLLMNGFVVIVQLNIDKLEEFQKLQQTFITFFQ